MSRPIRFCYRHYLVGKYGCPWCPERQGTPNFESFHALTDAVVSAAGGNPKTDKYFLSRIPGEGTVYERGWTIGILVLFETSAPSVYRGVSVFFKNAVFGSLRVEINQAVEHTFPFMINFRDIVPEGGSLLPPPWVRSLGPVDELGGMYM